jgi:hypothetical protein
MTAQPLTRDQLAARYFEQLEFAPYPVQEEALLAWFTSEQGVLVCAPTGTGKTLIAEAAVYEALHTGQRLYYTTPLVALTDQKFRELQALAVRWGFAADQVGLVTGNRRVNPQAGVLVVVAEILLNRLLHPPFEFGDVFGVVMDEFHNFNDLERGLVWEFSLGLLPPTVRLLLLSATVGNAVEFVSWLASRHQRRLDLVQSHQRKVPLTFQWVGDALLLEQLEQMAAGEEATRLTPALVFCFNREECWNVAEQIKGKRLLAEGQQVRLAAALEPYDWSQGAGPKLKQILQRGVGVHHAGVLPKYRRIVEDLFQRKLLTVTICTETLAAGVNLPARSVVLPGLLKILRWREKYDRIPEDTKDPGLIKAKKAMKKKMPHRRTNQQYWTEGQFKQLTTAPPLRLHSRGPLPWRMLAYMLQASPEVDRVRQLVSKRLMDPRYLEAGQKTLETMLLTLWKAGYVELDPPPPRGPEATEPPPTPLLTPAGDAPGPEAAPYRPVLAHPTPAMERLALLRGIHPLYGMFLLNHLGIADRNERLQAMESVLELPGSVAHFVRVPPRDVLPPGPLATTRLDVHLLQLGLVSLEELGAAEAEEDADPDRREMFPEERVFVLTLAEKLRRLFDYDFPGVHDVRTQAVWAAGEVLEFGDFNKYVTSKGLQKQEGIVFRHLLRLILLIYEFARLCPPDVADEDWRNDLEDIADRLTGTCRQVDPTSTDHVLEELEQAAGDEELL